MIEVTFRHHLRVFEDDVITAETYKAAIAQFAEYRPGAFDQCRVCRDTEWYVYRWEEVTE